MAGPKFQFECRGGGGGDIIDLLELVRPEGGAQGRNDNSEKKGLIGGTHMPTEKLRVIAPVLQAGFG